MEDPTCFYDPVSTSESSRPQSTLWLSCEFGVQDYVADFGTEEPWLAWLAVGLPSMVKTVPAFGETRDAFLGACTGQVVPAIGKAFADLRRLREVVAQSCPVATIHVENAYETFYGHLWRAYKASFQAVMRILGLDIRFLFQDDASFEKGAAVLVSKQPRLALLVERMRSDRATFQTELADYRNDVEHKGGTTTQVLAQFHRPDSAENAFQNVRQAMEEYVTVFVAASLPPGLCIVEIPEADRDPAAPVPPRFQVAPRWTAALIS